ncbi:MAG: hypothetical protein Q7R40_06395 [Phaeospirillum sp.]|nr:hypothetical protein [Phaeospirillum sp.]
MSITKVKALVIIAVIAIFVFMFTPWFDHRAARPTASMPARSTDISRPDVSVPMFPGYADDAAPFLSEEGKRTLRDRLEVLHGNRSREIASIIQVMNEWKLTDPNNTREKSDIAGKTMKTCGVEIDPAKIHNSKDIDKIVEAITSVVKAVREYPATASPQ